MNENISPQAEPKYTPQPEKKKTGSNSVCIVCLILGAILFITGFILFKANEDDYNNTNDYTNSFSSENVTDIDLDIKWADLTISQSDDDNIYIDAQNVPKTFKAEIKNGTFVTDYNIKSFSFFHLPSIFSGSDYDTTIDIKLPEKQYHSFILDMGAGESKISDIECKDMTMNCGAGRVNLNNIDCTSCDIDCGAGEVTVGNINCKNTLVIDGGAGRLNINGVLGGIELDQGTGEFKFTGTINGNIKADGGVGKMEFNLTNPSSDFGKNGKYTIDIDHGVGSTSVNYDQE